MYIYQGILIFANLLHSALQWICKIKKYFPCEMFEASWNKYILRWALTWVPAKWELDAAPSAKSLKSSKAKNITWLAQAKKKQNKKTLKVLQPYLYTASVLHPSVRHFLSRNNWELFRNQSRFMARVGAKEKIPWSTKKILTQTFLKQKKFQPRPTTGRQWLPANQSYRSLR